MTTLLCLLLLLYRFSVLASGPDDRRRRRRRRVCQATIDLMKTQYPELLLLCAWGRKTKALDGETIVVLLCCGCC